TTTKISCSNFGFSIPVNSTIQGITVEIEVNASGTFTEFQDIFTTKVANTTIGVSVLPAGPIPTADAYLTAGGSTELWGTTWTPAEVNNTGFGTTMDIVNLNGAATRTVNIDHIRMTVTYSTPYYSYGRGY